MIRSTILNLIFFPFSIFVAATAILVSFGAGGTRRIRWVLQQYCRAMLWLTKVILNARIEIRGAERFKTDGPPALIVSKHQSELDVFAPIAMFPDLAAIAMAELARYPLIGMVLRKLDYIIVQTEGPRRNQLSDVIEGSKRAQADGRPILIYPEGELMRVGSRMRYRKGVFHVYDALQCEATPVALSCGLVWPQRKWRKMVNQTCVIEFLEPIPPGMKRNEFMAEIERRIETRTMELIEEHGAPDVVAVARERHRLGLSNTDEAPTKPSESAHA